MLAQHTQPVFSETAMPGLGYAGDVTPLQAWEILKRNPHAAFIDVRTPAEWVFVGEPDLSSLGKDAIRLPWRLYPSFAMNTEFVSLFLQENLPLDAPLLFLCRSGGRSRDAATAITAQGYLYCYNIESGFEGEPDASGHRGTLSGWKHANLPWGQK